MIFASSAEGGLMILAFLALTAGVVLAIYRAFGRVNLEVRNPDKHMELQRHEAEMKKERVERGGKIASGLLGVASKFLKK